MRKLAQIICLVLVAKFSLNYWVMLPPSERQKIVMSYAIEFAQKARGKARVFTCVDPENWSVEIHAEMFEFGT